MSIINVLIPNWIIKIIEFILFHDTAIIAGLALWISYNEFFSKRRPWVEISPNILITNDRKEGGFNVIATPINVGNYPAEFIAYKKDVLIRIGDEGPFPAHEDTKGILFPNKNRNKDNEKHFELGRVYKQGMDKILNNQYKSNQIFVEAKVYSRNIGDSAYNYFTEVKYEVIIIKEDDKLITKFRFLSETIG